VDRTSAEVSYEIDAQDRIVRVGEGWARFAAENAPAACKPRGVEGRELWSFVEGAEVRHLYQLLVRRVRERGRAVEVPMRCDGPDVERHMTMRIEPAAHGHVRFSTRLLDEQHRPPIRLLLADAPRSEAIVAICCFCHAIREESPSSLPADPAPAPERWWTLERGVDALGLLEGAPVPKLSHGLCPDCFERSYGLAEVRP
jgi:hypothetical protein